MKNIKFAPLNIFIAIEHVHGIDHSTRSCILLLLHLHHHFQSSGFFVSEIISLFGLSVKRSIVFNIMSLAERTTAAYTMHCTVCTAHTTAQLKPQNALNVIIAIWSQCNCANFVSAHFSSERSALSSTDDAAN